MQQANVPIGLDDSEMIKVRHKSQTSFRAREVDMNSVGSYKTEAHTKKQMELLSRYQETVDFKMT